MKNIYLFIIASLFFGITVQAQVTVYHENFNGMTRDANYPGSTTWQYSDASPSTGTASGEMHVRSIPSNKLSETKFLYLNNKFSTIGYTGIAISWIDYRTQPNGQKANNVPVKLAYSTDNGATYTAVTVSQSTTYNTWNRSSATLPISNVVTEKIRLRWEITTPSTNQDYYAIDDITITGMPEEGISTFDWGTRPLNENPFVVSAPGSATPYSQDGVKIFLSKTSAAGVNMTESLVTTRFQSPKQSLSLVQTGATNTNGTDIQIQFNEPVSDLSFTLFDVDRVGGQFLDRLVITGVNAFGGTVALSRNKVQTTTMNGFTTANGVVGQSVSDVPANSTEGNVKVTFSEEVVRVVIRYLNSDAGSGQQGIAINNLSWRKLVTISPLPVTLVSFKGALQNGAVKLSWSTASEIDNDKFVIERSQDGKIFKAIGEVKGKGTTNLLNTYSFADKNPVNGTNYYRLKQMDFNGEFEYSKTIALNLEMAATSSVYPTLASSEITVKLGTTGEKTNVLVTDMTGKQVTLVERVTDQQLVLPVHQLKSGIYFVTIQGDMQKETIRFVKQ
ncbi:T9SS type A sorting domain-containing protein [Pontibacter aquaedesilientis]|uniref:T9SS type A sorting domain-containing protein n=1 Tax=Pontibacter aquaedesilientis TaxID=2766980 RepID=UPI003744A4AE